MIEPCSDSGAYIAEPEGKKQIDMEECHRLLKEKDYSFKFESEVIHQVVDPKYGVEIGIYPSGKLLFKTQDREMVDELFEHLKTIISKLTRE